MRIQKDIENLERVKDKMATMPLTFEDAIEFHKQVVDRIEKERKEVNKELGIGDIEEDGFTGASKEPKKVSTPELKKMKLSESLFSEDWSDYIAAEEEEEKRIAREKREKEQAEKVWDEKDWIAEKERADKEKRELDLGDYSDKEKEVIKRNLDDYDKNATAKKQRERRLAAEEKKKKEEAEKKKKERREKALNKAAKAPADLAGSVLKGASKSGLHIG